MECAAAAVRRSLIRLLRGVRPGLYPSDILALGVDPSAAFEDAVIDVAVNAGLPMGGTPRVPLAPGDLVTIDLAARFRGVWADLSDALVVPGPSEAGALGFLRDVRRATQGLIESIRPGRLWSGLIRVWRESVEGVGLTLVPGFAGHGIGRVLHETPAAPYAGAAGGPVGSGDDFTIRPGLVFTVEPVLRSGCGRWVSWAERVVAVGSEGARTLGGSDDDLGLSGA